MLTEMFQNGEAYLQDQGTPEFDIPVQTDTKTTAFWDTASV
jgi:hypothetical protein